MNKYIKYYEYSPIQVILQNDDGKSDEKKTDEGKTDERKSDEGKSDGGSGTPTSNKNLVGIIVGSVVGGLVLIAAIVVIIIVVKKKKSNSNEISTGKSEKNILPNSAQVELVEGDNFGN